MRLLLDTHIWLWSLMEPVRIKPKILALFSSEENEVWLSPITPWEALILAQKGRLHLGSEPQKWVLKSLESTGAKEAALTHDIAVQSRLLKLPQADPADRFLVATARALDLHLVTSDKKILKSKACSLIPG